MFSTKSIHWGLLPVREINLFTFSQLIEHLLEISISRYAKLHDSLSDSIRFFISSLSLVKSFSGWIFRKKHLLSRNINHIKIVFSLYETTHHYSDNNVDGRGIDYHGRSGNSHQWSIRYLPRYNVAETIKNQANPGYSNTTWGLLNEIIGK